MKLPLSWIREVIDINLAPQQIAKALTLAGLEVEGVYPDRLPFENVVVGEVLDVRKHPDAEQLKVATVTDGKETYQVVCGAPNCRKGMKSAFANVGAKLKDETGKEFKIKIAKLRGVESHGMLCSEKELGLGRDAQGIIEFADHMVVGADVAEIFADTLFEIALTPNLGHCASAIGVARELSAATGMHVKYPPDLVEEDSSLSAAKEVQVDVKDTEKCPRYACRIVRNLKIGPSPEWMQKRLIACDFRPVNNIVDITNYVLLELGHPLHAFDLDKVSGHRVIVRPAGSDAAFETLDGKKRGLEPEDLMICDAAGPIAIAGVMGGANTEVGDATHNILLESAYFLPTAIRRTSKRLGLQTEASKRFERGCDPNNVLRALNRAAQLMHELAGGAVCEGLVDIKVGEFPGIKISCRLSRINRVLGTQLSLSEVETIFTRLEMPYAWDGYDTFTVRPPTYRTDVQDEIDLIEEVARIFGYDNIQKKPSRYACSNLPHAPMYLLENEIRSRLLAEGLQEFLTCDLIGPSLLNIVRESVMPEDAVVRVINPTSIEQSVLRTSLLPALLQAVKYNYDREQHDISAFEIGRVHFRKEAQYKEQSVAGILLSGQARPAHWHGKQPEVDFFDLKGIVENLLAEVGVGTYSFKNNGLKLFHPGRQASVYVDSLEIGTLGEVHPAIVRRLDVPQKIYFAELDLQNLYKVKKADMYLEELPIFPCSTRDFTLTIPEDAPIQEVFDAIAEVKSKLLERAALVGIYRSEAIGRENKNVTLRFVYRDKKKTVAHEAVEAEHAKMTSQIESRIRRK